MSRAASDAILNRILERMQADRRIRLGLGALLIVATVLLTAKFAYDLVPRTYRLKITGGDILSNRHYLARVLQAEAKKKGILLSIIPKKTTYEALDAVSKGGLDKEGLDLAFVPGGMDATHAHVDHVATVLPELVHLLVKHPATSMKDLKGRSINLGRKDSAAREIFLVLTRFAGYREDVDYVETNYDAEQLLSMPERKMPDAILTLSSVPSYLVGFLVNDHDYDVVEIPFPESLALRHGWAANGEILAYTYDTDPAPVPKKNIVTVAVNMHLVANSSVDPAAISKLLEVIYSPSVANTLRQKIDETKVTVPSGYPLSPGLTAYLDRNVSIFTLDNYSKLSSTFGLVMSFAGMGIVVARWFRGAAPKPVFHDDDFRSYLAIIAGYEKEIATMEAKEQLDAPDRERARGVRDELHALRISILERYGSAMLTDPLLFDRAVASAQSAHEHARHLVGRAS